MSALADPIRSRLLLLLERHELTVGELCAVLQLPQSTVSRHLKTLTDDAWITSRRDGTSRFYAMDLAAEELPAKKLWGLVREQMSDTPAAEQDARRLEGVLQVRRSKSQEFFSGAAEQWDRLRTELFGNAFQRTALLAMLDETAVVGDLGCGTGQISETLAPFVKRVIAVDESGAMLQSARRRLKGLENVEVRRGQLEALPIDDGELDWATIVLVLHHLADPAAALRDAARVIRGGGKVLVVDMLPHDRQEYRQEMGHVWLGFEREQLERWFREAGFERMRFHPLPSEPDAKGPDLFVASARRKK
jgi:ArsR family transcriptional regulator